MAPVRSILTYILFIASFLAISCPGAQCRETDELSERAYKSLVAESMESIPAQSAPVKSRGADSQAAADKRALAAKSGRSSGSTGRPRVILALGGGGTRGLAHIGVLRVLQREGIHIDGIAGTSMGAIVGGLFAAGLNPDQIEDLMRNRSMLHAYDTVPSPVRLACVPVFALPHAFGYHPYDGLYRGNKFATYINTVVPPSKKNIEDFDTPFVAVATDLLEGKPYTIRSGDIGRAIQASSALPGLRRPLYFQEKLLVDGGVLQNLPTDQAKDMDADVVIAVDVDGVHMKMASRDFRRIGSVTFRCINLHLKAIDSYPSTSANVVVRPCVGDIGLLSRNMHDITIAITEGEKATRASLPEIRAEIERVTTELAEGKPAEGKPQ